MIRPLTSLPDRRTRLALALTAPGWPALLMLLTYGSLWLGILNAAGGDPTFFVHARDKSDGIWYYTTARAPFDAAATVPALYYQRILYPALAWGLAAGQPAAIAWSLLLLNLVAATVAVYLLALLLRAGGRSPWWALLLGGHLALFVPLYYDLAEPLSLALILGSLLLLARGRLVLAWSVLLLAVLAKEIALVLGAALFLHYLLQRAWQRAAGVAGIVAGGYALWEAVVWLQTGAPGFVNSGLDYSPIPLLHALRDDLSAGRAAPWPFLIQLGIPALGLAGLVLWSGSASRRTLVGLLVLAETVFVLYLPWPTTSGFIHYDRTGVGLLLGGLLLGTPGVFSPAGDFSRRVAGLAYGLVGLSTVGGWLLIIFRAQSP